MINLLEVGDNIGQLTKDLETRVSNSLGRLRASLEAIPTDAPLFLHVKKDLELSWGAYSQKSLDIIGYGDLRVQAVPLLEQIEAIAREKGSRANILTHSEHRRSGSTVWDKFAEEPDIPLGILALRWNLDEGHQKLTVEEARIARELRGKTTLDESGKVTGRVNSDVKDSYHFLPSQRKAEIIELEQNAVRALGDIAREAYRRHEETYRESLAKLKEYMVGKFSTPEILAINNKVGFGAELIERVWLMSFHYGFRDYMLTPQEIIMSGRKVERKYRQKPYVPIGIQSGAFSAEEIKILREQEKSFPSYTRAFSKWRMPFRLSLEPLADSGETTRGPTICDEQTHEPLERGSPRIVSYIEDYVSKGQAKAHFARPQDWYFRQG